MKNQIFEVDVKGLRQLQEGKPKFIIIRELLQNAIDEPITACHIELRYEHGKARIKVSDDSTIGFRDLSDAYTIFADTYKRTDATKRGRFNFGEKQVICLCDYARIISTTGGVEFQVLKGERNHLRRKIETGSEVYIEARMTQNEYRECFEYCKQILMPENINIQVVYYEPNSDEKHSILNLEKKEPHLIFTAKLLTEIKQDDVMKNISRETIVHLHKKQGAAYIYEMGIPICEIDCDYSIDVQQKVPLSADRDKVDGKYLKTIYGEVLNQTHEEIKEEQASNMWVREGTISDRATTETKKDVLAKRFGENKVIANPFDQIANDDALAHGYNLIHGAEMSKEEWESFKKDDLIKSSTAVFGKGTAPSTTIKPNSNQQKIEVFIKKIASEILYIKNLHVRWIRSPQATVRMTFDNNVLGYGKELTVNLSKCKKAWWDISKGYICQPLLDLIIHELGHSSGHHIEHSYHECLTLLGSSLTIKAMEEPNWFKI